MTKGAVGINKRLDARLQAAVGQRSGCGLCGRGFSIFFAFRKTQLETLEKSRPIGVDRLGIGAPAFIVIINQSLAPPGGKSYSYAMARLVSLDRGDRSRHREVSV